MAGKTFALVARVSTANPRAVRSVLKQLMPKGSVSATDEGFFVKATMRGADARSLNRALLTALRRVGRKTRLRAEWTSGGVTARFFDYVPKGVRKA